MAITLKVNKQSRTIDVPGDTAAALGLAGRSWPERHEVWLWNLCLWGMYGPREWSCGAILRDAREFSGEQEQLRPLKALQIRRSIPFKWLGKKLMCLSAVIVSQVRLCPRWRCSRTTPKPTDTDIDSAMSGNLCRCGTYPRIREAIHRAAELQTAKGGAR